MGRKHLCGGCRGRASGGATVVQCERLSLELNNIRGRVYVWPRAYLGVVYKAGVSVGRLNVVTGNPCSIQACDGRPLESCDKVA